MADGAEDGAAAAAMLLACTFAPREIEREGERNVDVFDACHRASLLLS